MSNDMNNAPAPATRKCEPCGNKIFPSDIWLEHLSSPEHLASSVKDIRLREELVHHREHYVVTSSAFKGNRPALTTRALLEGLLHDYRIGNLSFNGDFHFYVLRLRTKTGVPAGDRTVTIGDHRVLLRLKAGLTPFEIAEIYNDDRHHDNQQLARNMMERAKRVMKLSQDHCDTVSLMNAHVELFITRNPQN